MFFCPGKSSCPQNGCFTRTFRTGFQKAGSRPSAAGLYRLRSHSECFFPLRRARTGDRQLIRWDEGGESRCGHLVVAASRGQVVGAGGGGERCGDGGSARELRQSGVVPDAEGAAAGACISSAARIGGKSWEFIGPVNDGHEIQAIQLGIPFHPNNRL